MKKFLIILGVFFLSVTGVFAQRGGGRGREKMEKIHAAKMAYITDRLQLSDGQSGNFIPVYNEYEKEIREMRRFFMDRAGGPVHEDLNDSLVKQTIDDNLDYQEKVIAIKRKYNDRFLQCITPKQLKKLPEAEREFKKMLIHQMEMRGMERGGDRPHPGWGRGF